MIPMEMQSLMEMIDDVVANLNGRDCDDVIEALLFYKAQVKNDFTAKVSCRAILTMCHPEAWGDRFVTGMNHAHWLVLLNELKSACAQAIERIEQRQARG